MSEQMISGMKPSFASFQDFDSDRESEVAEVCSICKFDTYPTLKYNKVFRNHHRTLWKRGFLVLRKKASIQFDIPGDIRCRGDGESVIGVWGVWGVEIKGVGWVGELVGKFDKILLVVVFCSVLWEPRCTWSFKMLGNL